MNEAAATAVTPVSVPTRTGVERSVVVPSPRPPNAFYPQAQTVPSDLAA